MLLFFISLKHKQVQFRMFLITYRAMKILWWSKSIVLCILGRSEWSASCSDSFTPRKEPPVPIWTGRQFLLYWLQLTLLLSQYYHISCSNKCIIVTIEGRWPMVTVLLHSLKSREHVLAHRPAVLKFSWYSLISPPPPKSTSGTVPQITPRQLHST